EDAAPQTPFRVAHDPCRNGARAAARKLVLLCHGHRRLCQLDARPDAAAAGFPLPAGPARRLAHPLARMGRDAVRGKGAQRGTQPQLLFRVHPAMTFIIYGVGAIGGTLAAKLALSGADVAGIARGAQRDAIAADGLLLRTPDGAARVRFPVVADPAALE